MYATYPVVYVRNFNFRPTELILSTTDCKDGTYQSDVTCGWYTDAAGARIPNSQGYCCPCTAQESWQQTALGEATGTTRGNLNCNLFTTGLFASGVPATASCLRFDPLWYSGYSIGPASYDFKLTVSISGGSPSSQNSTGGSGAANASSSGAAPPSPAAIGSAAVTQQLQVSPFQLTAVALSGQVAVELLGDLGGFQETPVLQEKMLLMPFYLNGSSGSSTEWMLVDNTQVDTDGTRCNAIGTSFAAFNTQPGACTQPQGSCLGNQIYDLYSADKAAIRAGATPKYFLSALGVGSILDPLANSANPTSKRLALPSSTLRNSVLTLTLAADSVRFVVNREPGFILSASLVDFGGNATGSFTALSGNGRVLVSFANNGTLAAGYFLNIVNCSDGVMPFPSPGEISVPGGGVSSQAYLCTVTVATAARRSCTVVLLDALSAVLDSRQLVFYTNATVFTAAPTLLGNASGPGAGAQPGMIQPCSQACPDFHDAACFLLHRCWGAIGKLFSSVLGAALLGLLLWKFGAFSALLRLLKGCCAAKASGEEEVAVPGAALLKGGPRQAASQPPGRQRGEGAANARGGGKRAAREDSGGAEMEEGGSLFEPPPVKKPLPSPPPAPALAARRRREALLLQQQAAPAEPSQRAEEEEAHLRAVLLREHVVAAGCAEGDNAAQRGPSGGERAARRGNGGAAVGSGRGRGLDDVAVLATLRGGLPVACFLPLPPYCPAVVAAGPAPCLAGFLYWVRWPPVSLPHATAGSQPTYFVPISGRAQNDPGRQRTQLAHEDPTFRFELGPTQWLQTLCHDDRGAPQSPQPSLWSSPTQQRSVACRALRPPQPLDPRLVSAPALRSLTMDALDTTVAFSLPSYACLLNGPLQ